MTTRDELAMLRPMSFEIVPAHDLPLHEQARLGNEAFAGYVGGWSPMDTDSVGRFLCAQGADLCYSRFVRSAGALGGFGYINRTGNVLRLSGMGIIPEARGSGVAGFLLEHLLSEGTERGDALMTLEVIEQNPRAHALYRRHDGFTETDRLFGWRRATESAAPELASTEIEEVDLLDALRMPSAQEYPQIPWQVSRHALLKVPVVRAFQAEHACVVIGDPAATPIAILGFLSEATPTMDWELLRSILRAVLARYPSREFLARPKFPSEHGEQIFAPLGFAREPINQFLMQRRMPD